MSIVNSNPQYGPQKPQLQRFIQKTTSGKRLYFGSAEVGQRSSQVSIRQLHQMDKAAKPGIKMASYINKIGQWFCKKLGLKKRFVTHVSFDGGVTTHALNKRSLMNYLKTVTATRDFFSHVQIGQENKHTPGRSTSKNFQPLTPMTDKGLEKAYDVFLETANELQPDVNCPKSAKIGALLADIASQSHRFHADKSTNAERQASFKDVAETGLASDGRTYKRQPVYLAKGRKFEHLASKRAYGDHHNWKAIFEHIYDYQTDYEKALESERQSLASDDRDIEVIAPAKRRDIDHKIDEQFRTAIASKTKSLTAGAVTSAVGWALGGPVGGALAAGAYIGAKSLYNRITAPA